MHQKQTALPDMFRFIHYFQLMLVFVLFSEAAYHTLPSLCLDLSSLSAADAREENEEGEI